MSSPRKAVRHTIDEALRGTVISVSNDTQGNLDKLSKFMKEENGVDGEEENEDGRENSTNEISSKV